MEAVGIPHSQERLCVGLRLRPLQEEKKAVSNEENLEQGLQGWYAGQNEKCPQRAFDNWSPVGGAV